MFFKDIDFSKYSSIKIGGTISVMVLELDDEFPQDRTLIGSANNILISDSPAKLMMLSKDFDYIKIDNGYLEIGAATPTGKILSFVKKEDIGGFEFISKLPGTLGGMLAMNAGVKEYEIFNILHSIAIDGQWLDKELIEHGYRYANLNGIATKARFKIVKGFNKELLNELKNLRSNQPKEPSAGSAFKNPKDNFAGRLIEEVGLKGKKIGAMELSSVHANFLVNNGGGTFKEAKELLELAKSSVKSKFNIDLQEEIIIV